MKLPTRFGAFGGVFAPESMVHALEELEAAFVEAKADSAFNRELEDLLANYAGRPTPLYVCRRFGAGNTVVLKREDLLHGGAHKTNNALGQALLAKRMGKKRVIAETGAGMHGTATAMACALLGLECEVYMGSVDAERQEQNVKRMELMGAKVTRVDAGSRTLKDAVNEAMRDFIANSRDTHYLLGSVLGPHPYPSMVAHFQAVIGKEARKQFLERFDALPDEVIACVGGGSNAIGIFSGFLGDKGVKLVGVEAGGYGIESGRHAARFSDALLGKKGILHGTYTYLLQDAFGQVKETHSVSAGLDYSAVGPMHAELFERGRASYTFAEDGEAVAAFKALSQLEGIIPALESAHALAYVEKICRREKGRKLLVCLSGRGDKDLGVVMYG